MTDEPESTAEELLARRHLLEECRYLLEQSRSPRLRTLAEFASQEIVLPNGPYRGMRMRESMQPAHYRWFGLVDSARWSRHAFVGPVQSGKTMAALVIPLMHTLFERQETAILGAPKMEIAHDKWREDFLPVIQSSRYAKLLPRSGSGSRGGKPQDHVQFEHGVTLKIMSGQGSDDSRSAYTSRFVFVTEVDKMDTAGETSREADPVSQLEDRTFAFDRHGGGRIFLECTASHSSGRIWREYEAGTGSRLAMPCPHCGAWVQPDREHFGGYEDAQNEEQAADLGSFFCPACGQAWSQQERLAAAAESIVVHRGQTINRRGRVLGDPPATRTLGFRATAADNAFVSDGSIAVKEWRARKLDEESEARANEEKTLRQKIWAMPYDPPHSALTPLSDEAVRKRGEGWPRGVLPPDTEHLAIGVDVGKWRSWWLALALRPGGRLHVPAYGQLDVCTQAEDAVELKLIAALREFRAVCEGGYAVAGGGELRAPDTIWIDSNYLTSVVCAFVREAGERWLPTVGRGETQLEKYRYAHPKRTGSDVRKIGDQWHLRRNAQEKTLQATVNADFWKIWVQERLSATVGEPGAMSLYLGTANEHGKLAKHFTNETRVREFTPGKGWRESWRKSGDNHWLDCAALAAAAGNYLGWRLQPEAAGPARPAARWLGTAAEQQAPQAASGAQPAPAGRRPEAWFADKKRRPRSGR